MWFHCSYYSVGILNVVPWSYCYDYNVVPLLMFSDTDSQCVSITHVVPALYENEYPTVVETNFLKW